MVWYLGFDSTPTTLQSDTGDPLQPVYFGCPFPLTHPLKSAQPAYYKQNPKEADQHAMAAAAGLMHITQLAKKKQKSNDN